MGISMHSQQRLVTISESHPQGSRKQVWVCSISRARHTALACRLFHSHPAIPKSHDVTETSPSLLFDLCGFLQR